MIFKSRYGRLHMVDFFNRKCFTRVIAKTQKKNLKYLKVLSVLKDAFLGRYFIFSVLCYCIEHQ